MSALDKQEGGSHYKGYAIQPVEFIHQNDLGFLEGCVIKRLCRWQMKDGIKDLRKAIHEIELLIEQTEAAEKREHAESEAREALTRRQERASVQLGHPRIGDSLTPAAIDALKQAYGPKGDPLDAVNQAPAAVGRCQVTNLSWLPAGLPDGTVIEMPTSAWTWGRVGVIRDGELVRDNEPR